MTAQLPRVLHITIALNYGGMEMMLARLIEADRGKREHWVIGIMGDTSPDPAKSYTQLLTDLGATVFSLGFAHKRPSLAGISRLWRIFRTFRPALLCGWSYHGNLAVGLLALSTLRRIKAIINIRCSVQLHAKSRFVERMFFVAHRFLSRFAAAIIFNSKRAADEHVRHGYPSSRLAVIPNGFDIDRFRPDSALRQDARGKLALSEGDIVVGLVGRFHRDKDHATFLSAAAQASRLHPGLVFLIAGAGTEAVLTDPTFAPMIEAIGMSKVKVIGHVSDMPALYNALDICVLSSLAEGFPNVLGEAMACGVPCISTDVGDAAYIVGDTGFICPPADSLRLGEDIASVAMSDVALLGSLARKRIVEKFPIAQIHHEFDRLWQRCTISPTQFASSQRAES